jgi:hypothetical protein
MEEWQRFRDERILEIPLVLKGADLLDCVRVEHRRAGTANQPRRSVSVSAPANDQYLPLHISADARRSEPLTCGLRNLQDGVHSPVIELKGTRSTREQELKGLLASLATRIPRKVPLSAKARPRSPCRCGSGSPSRQVAHDFTTLLLLSESQSHVARGQRTQARTRTSTPSQNISTDHNRWPNRLAHGYGLAEAGVAGLSLCTRFANMPNFSRLMEEENNERLVISSVVLMAAPRASANSALNCV